MISVIVPVYNVETYLDKCLQSIVTNTYRDLEIICINDGSTDSCPEILKKWQEKDSRIIVINQENLGLPGARNSGLDIAKGKYIAFIDSDDIVHPRYFQSLLNCMEEKKADMVVCGCQKFNVDEEPVMDSRLSIHYSKLTSREFYRSYYARHMVWARLIRRKDTTTLRFPPEVDSLQDTLFNLRLICSWKHPVFYETDSPLYYYLQRPGSLVKSRPYAAWLQIADWYVANRYDSAQIKGGDWSWTLLLQCISMCLSCRYHAYIWKSKGLVKRINSLLRPMISEMLRNRFISPAEKLTRMFMYLFPSLYRLFRIVNDPTLLKMEREIREKLIQ